MSGVEVLAIAASVIQIADMGARLSVKLYTFARKAKNVDRSIQNISQEIAATGAALRELGEALEEDKYARLGTQQSIKSTSQIVADCKKIFADINKAIGGENLIKSSQNDGSKEPAALDSVTQPSFNYMQRIKFPFVEPQIDLLKSKLESLKTSLILMLQVLNLAEQIRKQVAMFRDLAEDLLTMSSRSKVPIAQEQQAFIQTLILERNAQERRFERLTKTLENQKVNASGEIMVGTSRRLSASDMSKEVGGGTERALSPGESELHPGLLADPQLSKWETSMPIDDKTPEKEVANLGPADPSLRAPSGDSKTHPAAIEDDHVNPLIRIRQEEIEHHVCLVNKLLEEIGDVQYRIGHGIRYRMHEGVLKTHWDEWSPLAKRFSDQVFMETFNTHSHVLRYWLDQAELELECEEKKKKAAGDLEARRTKVQDQRLRMGSSDVHRANRESAIDLSRPTYIVVNIKYLSPATLDHFRLPWEWDEQNPGYMVIKEYINEDTSDELFEHTRMLRENKLITSGNATGVVSRLGPAHESITRWTQLKDKLKSLGRSPRRRVSRKPFLRRRARWNRSEGDVSSYSYYSDDSEYSQVGRTASAKIVRKDKDEMFLSRETTPLPLSEEDEVQDLLLLWTDLTADELQKAGLTKHERKSPTLT